MIAEPTRLAMAASLPHHRTPEFAAIHKSALADLRWLWDTDDDVVAVAGSGTAGMEGAMRTVLGRGDRVLAITGGKFADRWRQIAGLIGCDLTVYDVEWGRAADPEVLTELLEAHAHFDAMVCVASETSTGVLHPVARLGAAFRAHSPDGLVLVDGITAVGCVDLSMRRDAFDVLVSGSQKSFGLPPGAAFVGIGARAWERASARDGGHYYLDMRRERKQTETGQSAYTPAIALTVGLSEVMGRWRGLGREALFAHASALSAGALAGTAALGLERFAETPSPALTAVTAPESIDTGAVTKRLESHYGVKIAGGQEHLKGRLLRIGHLGAVDALDVVQAVTALGYVLADLGAKVDPGAGAAAAANAMGPLLREATVAHYYP